MAKFDFYRELREHMGYVLRKQSGVSKKKMRKSGADPIATAIKWFFEAPSAGMTLDAAILADEEDYIHQGRRVYIPQNKELVEMLWRSKINVELADLSEFPRSFSVAWPQDCVIDGVELPGCLVWFGRQKDREKLAKMMEKWTGVPAELIGMGGYQTDPEEHSFHLAFGEGSGMDRWYMRASMPEEWIADCLKSEGDLKKKLGDYDSPLIKKLEPEDLHKQYVTIRSVINLMVYAVACPEAVASGWPEGVGSSPQTRGRKPNTLTSPIPKYEHQGGTHASPEPHFRNPHFRQYPIRNGKRKKGIVFVSGCLVNAEIDPKTVVKVGKKKP
jgi:hypothetical protein